MNQNIMWAGILLAVLCAVAAGVLYLVTRFGKFRIIRKAVGESKRKGILAGCFILIGMAVIISVAMGGVNTVVCFLHLAVFWLLCDLVNFLVRKVRKKREKYYLAGVAALTVTALYLAAGWHFAHKVYETHYNITTAKEISAGSLRVVQISDSHIGAIFHWKKFEDYIEKINAANPDIVVITGDYIDDGTSGKDMEKCCEALGKLKTNYGVYFVFGNHDKGYYSEKSRGYNASDLIRELEKNQVVVLEDEKVYPTDGLCIIGRQDLSEKGRADMEQLMEGVDKENFILVLDHQPGDYEAQEAAQVDLVLSGHTHGGRFIPILYAGEWLGVNDQTYGHEKRTKTDFIVSSGIADWAIKFKTGCISEYVVIDIQK